MLLWRTTVPSSLHLPRIDESAAFGGSLVNHARRFERYLDWDWVLGTVAVLASYVVMVRRGRTLAARLGLRPVNAGIVLGLLTLTVAWAAALPFDVAANWWERRHGISHQGYASQLAGDWGTLLGTSATAFVVLAIVLTLARRFGRRWWLATAPTLAAILLAFQFVSPYVAALGTHPVRSPVLRADIRTLERREHAGHPTVRVDDVSGTTSEANAFSIGIGPTAHVLIWNTLLDGRFSPDQVRFVVGHELGHLARNHILRGVAWFALILLPILAITAFVADVRRPAAVPLALLVIALLQLAVLPLRNAISRRYEAEADWIGLTGTGDATAARDLFVGFVKTSLQDPSPPGWVHVLLDDHPTPLQRVEMTRAWSSRNR